VLRVKRGDIAEVLIKDMKFPNKGVGYINEKPIIIKNAWIGQKVEARISKRRSTHYEGKLYSVVTKSSAEHDSFCPHFGKCGGCALQTFPVEFQSELKATLVEDMLRNTGIEGFEFNGVIQSPDAYEYRNKMEFSFGDEEKGGIMTLGMHKKGRFHDVVNVDYCKIVEFDFTRIARATREYFLKDGAPKYNKRMHEGFLRHLTVRKGTNTGEILIGLSATSQIKYDFSEWIKVLLDLELDGEIVGILHIVNDGMGDVVQGDIDILYGRDYYNEKLMGLDFKVSFYSFFQTNTNGAEVLYKTTMDYMDNIESKTVFDLFSGTGTIGQIMASKAKEVVGVELVEDAVIAANKNANLNGIGNCTFLAGDVFVKLDEVDQKPDVIVVDPPRVGITEKALAKIIGYGVEGMTYVSCNPRSLALNLLQLQQAGYQVEKVVCVDMFPHTPHVETVVQLRKK